MSESDYDIHLGREHYDSLWDFDSDGVPFEEDMDALNKIIAEECGSGRRRRRKRKPNQ